MTDPHVSAYARYTQLIQLQLAALEANDFEQVSGLSEARVTLEEEISRLPSLTTLGASVLDALSQEVERGLHAEALLRHRLREHRDQLRDHVRRADPPEAAVPNWIRKQA